MTKIKSDDRIGVRISKELRALLEREATAFAVSEAHVVRVALRTYFSERERSRARAAVSVLDLCVDCAEIWEERSRARAAGSVPGPGAAARTDPPEAA